MDEDCDEAPAGGRGTATGWRPRVRAEFSRQAPRWAERGCHRGIPGPRGARGEPSGIHVLHDYPTALLGDELLVHLGDLAGGDTRKLLAELDIPQVAALGVQTVAEVIVRYTSVPDLEERLLTLPVTVNLVPGEQPPTRLSADALYAERGLQQAQASKRAAIRAMRDGESKEAEVILNEASERLVSAIQALPEQLRGPLEEDLAELRNLATLARSQDVELTVKTAFESMTSLGRSRPMPRRRASRGSEHD